MTAPTPLAAQWLVRAYHELQRHRHIVLHGNVDDAVRWGRDYHGLPEVLGEFLALNRFAVVARFSRVDGLTYRDQESADTARRLTGQATASTAAPTAPALPAAPAPGAPGAPAAPPPMAAGPPSARADAGRRSADDLRREMAARPPAQQRSLPEALGVIRRLMLQDQAPCAVVIDSADLIVGAEGQLDDSYPATVTNLRRLLDEARDVVVNANGDTLRNSLIFVTREIGSVPAWLRESPNVAVVLADRPGSDERIDLVARQLPRFHGAPATLTDEERLAAARAFAILTDGMTVKDIQALEVTSRIAGIGADQPRRLVARHRFGLRDDPWEQLDIDKVRHAERVLGARVMGQQTAVRAVADAIISARVGIDFVPAGADQSSRPRGVFFFVGPTGVGKTELAKAVAQLVFDDENAMKRFDMSEYSQDHASERFTGSPPGFVGHEQGGALTNWVLERPFSVLLFDEIEKANPRIFDKFLQIIDDGRLTDGQGRTAYFSHSIVIFTSNKGAATMPAAAGGMAPSYEDLVQHFNHAVRVFFTEELGRPELLGRLGGGIVVFDMLREPTIRAITAKFISELTASARAKGYELVLDNEAVEAAVVWSVMGAGAGLGARPIRDPLLEQWIRAPLNRWIIEHNPPPGTRISIHRTPGDPPFAVQETQAIAATVMRS